MTHAGRSALLAVALLVGGVTVGAAASSVEPAGSATPTADSGYQAYLRQHRQKSAEEKLQGVQISLRQLHRKTVSRGRVYVRMIRLGLLPLSDGFEGMVTHANRAERLRRALARDIADTTRFRREERLLQQGLAATAVQRKSTQDGALDYERSRDAIEAARERDVAYRRAFDADWRGKTAHTAIYGAPGGAFKPGTRFAQLRGVLPFPIKGRTEMKSIRLPEATGPGMLVGAPAGAPVLAVFGGKVILTGQYGDLGIGVVLDHGGGYTTLCGRLGSVSVEVGDELGGGAQLGSLPPDGNSKLYFEVRYQGSPIDPAEWFGI